MERDMVLIRKILFAIEEKYTDRALSYHDLGLNDYTPEVVAYHCSLYMMRNWYLPMCRVMQMIDCMLFM